MATTTTTTTAAVNNANLFACSRCYSRHPFEELSAGQQLCSECRGAFPVVKCTYCRSEFQQPSKATTTAICKKCEQNVKQFGKPSACEFCNIIAAFIGQKCQRCTVSEKKYGPPVTCESCKSKSAFDRKDEDKKVDGKLLCWLCTMSLKRALAKTRGKERHAHLKSGSGSKSHHHSSSSQQQHHHRDKPYDKRPQRIDVTKVLQEDGQPPSKQSRHHDHHHHGNSASKRDENKNINSANSDHVVAQTQLREQIANLQRQLVVKDKEIFAKDRQITELKAANFTTESECRNKLKAAQREHEQKVDNLNTKVKQLQKEVAVLTKSQKVQKASLTIVRNNAAAAAAAASAAAMATATATASAAEQQQQRENNEKKRGGSSPSSSSSSSSSSRSGSGDESN